MRAAGRLKSPPQGRRRRRTRAHTDLVLRTSTTSRIEHADARPLHAFFTKSIRRSRRSDAGPRCGRPTKLHDSTAWPRHPIDGMGSIVSIEKRKGGAIRTGIGKGEMYMASSDWTIQTHRPTWAPAKLPSLRRMMPSIGVPRVGDGPACGLGGAEMHASSGHSTDPPYHNPPRLARRDPHTTMAAATPLRTFSLHHNLRLAVGVGDITQVRAWGLRGGAYV